MLRYFFGLFFLVFVVGCGGVNPPPTPAMWKITSGKSTVHLLGSIHVGHASFYPLSGPIDQAYKSSDIVGAEVDILNLDQKKYNLLITDARKEKPNTKKNVTEAFANKIKDALFARRLDPEKYYQEFKLWYLFELLTQGQELPQGIRTQFGVDNHFLERAKQDKKEITAMETMELQINMLVTLGQDHPEEYFNYLRDPIQRGLSIVSVIGLWKRGDPDALAEALFRPLRKNPSYAPIYNKLFFERNIGMAKKIEGYLQTDKTYFVMVGAGHLVGEKSIPTLLKAKGFDIVQTNPEPTP